ncbi:MAG: hypothetical protein GXP60_04985 [Epsilonproteobacteria bacterium]|nr:hypothetical protein [Campylobacterota bacterium]
MEKYVEELKIAEKYLDETIKADKEGDFEGFVRRFDKRDLEGFTKDAFHKDVERMKNGLGDYISRSYLGSLEGFRDKNHPECLRFVWRGIYEKSEVLIIVGIHKKDDTWYLNASTVSK